MQHDADAWISGLGLVPDPEGGHFRQYHAAAFPGSARERTLITVRYHLLTTQAPRARLRRCDADHLYFHHAGGALRVCSVGADGGSQDELLGPPCGFQVVVAGGRRRTIELVSGPWALISEAMVPGRSADEERAGDGSLEAGREATLERLAGGVSAGDRSSAGEGVMVTEGSSAIDGASAEARSLTGAGSIAALGLVPHMEGGYFGERWRAAGTVATASGERSLASTIYYLLVNATEPVGRFHCNSADITHFYHSGGPIVYCTISPAGDWHEVVLGADARAGQVLAFTCPAGWWKSSHLAAGVEHGLISEIVAPGFDYADHRMADAALFMRLFPQHHTRWSPYVAGGPRPQHELIRR